MINWMWKLEVLSIDIPIEEPAKRWRNWYVCNRTTMAQCCVCGKIAILAGDEPWGDHCLRHPSKDVAVTRADGFIVQWAEGGLDLVHIDAYAEGERPPG